MQNEDGSNSRILSGQITSYQESIGNADHIVPDQIYLLETSSGITNYQPTTFSSSAIVLDNRYVPRIKLKSFDRMGNIKEVERIKDNTTSYLWGYNDSKPIAQIQNSDLNHSFGPVIYFFGSDVSTNQTTYTALTPSLTIDYHQTVTYSISIFPFSGTPTLPISLDVELRRSDGAVMFNPSLYELGNYSASFALPAGTYSFYYKGQSNSSTFRFNVTVNHTATTSFPKAFHTSFEETGVVLVDSKTGKKANAGAYEIKLPSAAGNYCISWWQKVGAVWSFQKQLVTVPYSTSYFTVGTGANFVDEVRMYPEKATMTTYTYDPVLGTTSSTDANDLTTYFEYDSFGRLQLTRDDQGNILNTNTYHTKSQN
jgi:YD repeat-containing protein